MLAVNQDNVDQREIDKFSEIAHGWWDKHGHFKTLHDINPLRLNWILSHLGNWHGQKIIDVGCGGGILAEAMAISGAEVLGIDLSEKALQVARLHQLESGAKLDYRKINLDQLVSEYQANNQTVDALSCLEMLEHVPNSEQIVKQCAKLVKPGGLVFFSTINRKPKAFALAVVVAEYLLNWLPRGTHHYANFIKPAELVRWARDAGLESIDLLGMSYNPFSKQYYLSDDLQVNYLYCARKTVI